VETAAFAQSVGLPLPRLLTTMPMGGKAGSKVEVTISGESLDDADELSFTDPRITATRKLDAGGRPEPNKYVLTIAPDCPTGVYECRLMTRLGLSSSRAFSVGSLPEVVQTKANTSLAAAMELKLNSVCNAVTTQRAVDHYTFAARKGQRVVVDCAARGIDSKLEAVLIVADAVGRDLMAERRGGVLDFSVPKDGRYVIKVHDLTFKGGPAFFYRLAVAELPAGAPTVRMPSTKPVNSFSWPPPGQPEKAATAEIEPNNNRATAQKVSLPCDIAGSFFPAADVDVFEFEARKGDVWRVEVGSERFGLPTNPSVLVQYIERTATGERPTDVAEFSDIPSPVKVSSNGYSYDGPPYNPGTLDVLGKLEIKNDGLHRLQISDLFGGTRSDPRNVYRLVIRKAAPDFALVGWGLHMELRNGDRNAVSKPLALRGGTTTAVEVVAFRRDGFDGAIELAMDGLPKGVTARGLRIPAGQSRGMMLVTAEQNAPRGSANAKFYGTAQVNGVTVKRPCRLASIAWPILDAWNDIPSPRLLADVPVSVSGFDLAPITIAPVSREMLTATAGQKLTVPLIHTRRSEFSGSTMKMKVLGAGFEKAPAFDVVVTADKSEAVLDLAALQTPPGDYWIAFYGGAVAKVAAKRQTATAKATTTDGKRRRAPGTAPRDIADIVVSQPIALRVKPAEKK
jgi:hypothetical protein